MEVASKPYITPQEKKILELMMEGHSNKEIAEILFVSKRTLEGHRARIMEKLEAKNTAQLIKFIFRHKLMENL